MAESELIGEHEQTTTKDVHKFMCIPWIEQIYSIHPRPFQSKPHTLLRCHTWVNLAAVVLLIQEKLTFTSTGREAKVTRETSVTWWSSDPRTTHAHTRLITLVAYGSNGIAVACSAARGHVQPIESGLALVTASAGYVSEARALASGVVTHSVLRASKVALTSWKTHI